MDIKEKVRVLAIDDSPHTKDMKETYLVGIVYRGKEAFDGIKISKITINGLDATEKIYELYKSFNRSDIRFILLDGITYAGFNIVDVKKLFEFVKIPIIIFIDHKPDFSSILDALKKYFSDWKIRYGLILSAGKIHTIILNGTKRYFQVYGTSPDVAKILLKKITLFGGVPEPLRVANLIAKSLVEIDAHLRN